MDAEKRLRIPHRRRITNAAIMVAVVGLISAPFVGYPVYLFFYYGLFNPYSSLKRTVVFEVGIDELRDCVVSVLDDPPETTEGPTSYVYIELTNLPGRLQQLGHTVYYVRGPAVDGPKGEHVLFASGGGFHRYGLKVGRKGYVPEPDSRFSFDEIADGVWGFYEGN